MSDSYISFSCSVCNKQYRTPSKNAGQKRTCTDCSNVHTIPSVSEQQQPKSKLIDCPDCDTSISRLAVACTRCGRPITADPHLIAISWSLSAILGILVFFMIMLILNEIFRWVILSRLNNR